MAHSTPPPRWRVVVCAAVIVASLAGGARREATRASAETTALDPGSSALFAVQELLSSSCLVLRATVTGATSNDVMLVSVGTYDPRTGVGAFWSLVRGVDTPGPLLVETKHANGLIQLSTVADLWHGSRSPGFTVSPRDLAHGTSRGDPALARLGRYQPGTAIDLLSGVDPTSIRTVDPVTSSTLAAVVDLDAATTKARDRTSVQAAVDAIPVRRLQVHIAISHPSVRVRRIEYLFHLPSGAGEPAQEATWTLEMTPARQALCLRRHASSDPSGTIAESTVDS